MSPSSKAGPNAPPPLNGERLLEAIRTWAGLLAERGDDAVDAYLDSRDSDPFDGQWTSADAALRSHKTRLSAERVERAQAESDRLRQSVFAAVIKTSGHADLAGYLSDDAELIYENEVLNLHSDWIDALRRSYESPPLAAD